MHELDDIALLRQYTEQNSEEAFAALVSRHLNKVYSVALRHTRNPHSAEEITQAVFIIFARRAKKLRQHAVLSGWLYETSRLTAVTFIRGEIRRARREQEAHMQALLNENESDVWPQIAPLLDAAMAGLNETDRHAVVLRFFDGKSMREVGAALGASEDAAKMRLNRAVEKMRGFFTKRGVVLSAAVLTAAISANSVQAAPVALAKTVTAVAIAKGSIAAASIPTLVKGTLKTMTWLKFKFALGIGMGILLAGGAVTVYSALPTKVVAAKFEFEADGELTVQQINGDNKIILQESESFEVSVKDGQWFIVTTPQPGFQPAIVRYEIGGGNGTIYQVSYLDRKILEPNSLNTAMGNIGTDIVPKNIQGNQVAELWLAFASSPYFDGVKNGKLKPIYQMIASSTPNENLEDTAKWKRFDAEPRLPRQVDYINEKNIGVNGGQRLLFALPAPFEKGFTRASYHVDSATNVGGLTLPTGFSFKEFYVNQNTQPAELKVMRIVQANVTSVRTVCQRTNFIPAISEATYIGDDRFARAPQPVEELVYRVTNGIWPATNVQWLQKML